MVFITWCAYYAFSPFKSINKTKRGYVWLCKNLITSYLTKSLLSSQLYFWTLYKVFPTLKIHEDHPVTHSSRTKGGRARLKADGLSELCFHCPVSRYTNSRAIFFFFFSPLFFQGWQSILEDLLFSWPETFYVYEKSENQREPKK